MREQVYNIEEVYWAIKKDQHVVPFKFNADFSRIMLLDSREILSLDAKSSGLSGFTETEIAIYKAGSALKNRFNMVYDIYSTEDIYNNFDKKALWLEDRIANKLSTSKIRKLFGMKSNRTISSSEFTFIKSALMRAQKKTNRKYKTEKEIL